MTVFMGRLRPDPTGTKVFRVHTTKLEGTVEIAQIADDKSKLSKLCGNWYNTSSTRAIYMISSASSRPESMDLSIVKGDTEGDRKNEAEL